MLSRSRTTASVAQPRTVPVEEYRRYRALFG
jgi:hypothetical protein